MENLQKDNEQLRNEFKLFTDKVIGRGKDILKCVDKFEEKEIEN